MRERLKRMNRRVEKYSERKDAEEVRLVTNLMQRGIKMKGCNEIESSRGEE